jgi:putative membrane-bound dehydrogenase-like protein
MRRPRSTVAWLAVALVLLAAPPIRPQGYSPDEAPRRMTPADGFAVKLVASEPLVRQPVAIDFDDRGRLWVIQYLQYPNPAGLKRVQVDRFSRTVYDRIPEPPPRGPRGDDHITILESPDAAGRCRKGKDFVNGLNLATGLAFGHGGVFVLQTPYLLFYPDRDGDDVPDGPPEVLLSGFGMEDAHSVANSLTWGPDGWLYGCQGSTVTARIRNPADPAEPAIEFQQGVWRYHPLTHRFELFCEGGGNSWGLDFDRHGNLLYSTNFGGFVMLHGVQGGYYWKSFGKHGPLHNPHAYGYFDHVPHTNFRGGHVTVGGIVYRGDAFPARFRDRYIAADLLGHNVYWHDLEPLGSSFRSRHGGDLLVSNDTWFAPCDVTLGPDGAVYVADWFDKRTAHPDPDADWDRSNGRIYRIEAKGVRPRIDLQPPLARRSSQELVALLSHPNDWYVRRARRILADRRDPEVILPLRTLVLEGKDQQLALEALWALYVSGGFSEPFAETLLGHANPHLRRWAVRFLGDDNRVSLRLGERLVELAGGEPDVSVRSQLASTAKRLPAAVGLGIVRRLLARNLDAADPHIPLLLWWAVEHHAVPARNAVLGLFASAEAWQTPLTREVILGRLTRRYAAEGTVAGYQACARLLASAPSDAERRHLVASLDAGLQERPPGYSTEVPPQLDRLLAGLWSDDTRDVDLIRLLARLDRPAARHRAVTLAADPQAAVELRVAMLRLLGEVGTPDCIETLLRLVGGAGPEPVRLAALEALPRFDREEVADALLRDYPRLPARLRSRAVDVLLGRKRWALVFLRRIDQGAIPAKEVAVDQLRPLAAHKDRQLDELVRKHWGTVTKGTPEEKLAEVRRLNNDLRAGPGDPRKGRELFRKHCATCHRLFDDGERLGPDLTHANRKDRDFLLVSLVDPSAVIRKEYQGFVVQTSDGRTLTGLIVEQSAGSITLADARNHRTTVARDKIESLQESPVSLMPENILKDLRPQELRDLFGYLQGDRSP